MPLACPHDSSSLAIQEVEGHIGYFCAGCRGVWLPSEYIASIGHTRRFSSESLQRTFAAFPFLGSDLHCPGNCGPLRRVFFKGLRLDWCPKCQGLWFDRGELAILLQHYPSLGGGESRSVDAVDLADIVEAIAQFFGSLH